MPDGTIDAIVTSPPYFVTYDYYDVQRLSYLAFGWPVHADDQIGKRYGHQPVSGDVTLPPALHHWYEQFGGEGTVLGRAMRVYVEQMRAHLREAARVLAPDGIVAYSVANTIREGRVFDLVGGFAELLEEAGFVNVEPVPRSQAGRRILPPGRNVSNGRFSRDSRNAGVREHVIFATPP